MAGYLIKLIGLSVFISVVGMITPKNGRKYTRLVCTLCLLCVILSPLPSIVSSDLFSVPEPDGSIENSEESFYAEIYNNVIRDASADRIADGLETIMVKDLDLPMGEFEVSVTVDDTNGYIEVKEARVVLYSGAVACDPHKIVSYLEEMLGCECEIVYL